MPSTAWAQEWYELYANGERALRNGQAQRAAELLQRAIQQRPQPGVAIPTYGTNFEPRYFPYLRLAEAYLRTEAYDDALRALETSARFRAEPAAERVALEARIRAGMDTKRPPRPAAGPSPESVAAPPTEPPPSAPPKAPAVGTEVPSPGAAQPSPEPSGGTSRPSEPVTPPDQPAVLAPPAVAPARPVAPTRREPPALEITSSPPGAEAFVDDMPVGRTDPETGRLRLATLAPGQHRVRLSLAGHDDLVRQIDLASESLAFYGALSRHEQPATPDRPPAEAPAESQPLVPFRPTLGLGIGFGLLVALALVLWLRSPSTPAKSTERGRTPPPVSRVGDEGTDEGLPVEFGDYRLIRRIGKGGMASVYEAERRGDRFALKRPLAGFLDDSTFLERFLREADLGRTLHHPNIVRIFDQGRVGPSPYFAMELIDGETLRARLDRDGRLHPTLAARITAQVAEALDYAHHKGVIHRDLKPSNIMLDRAGDVKVMDYGIARSQRLDGMTVTGAFLGTPQYAAPETVEARTEPGSDIYSLGVVFFEMLTGSLPFRGGTVLEVMHHHCVTPPPSPSSLNYALSKELDRIVLRLLSKDPSGRPTAEALLNELSDYLRRVDEAV